MLGVNFALFVLLKVFLLVSGRNKVFVWRQTKITKKVTEETQRLGLGLQG